MAAGTSYRVQSSPVQPPPADLEAVVFPDPTLNPRYTSIPADLPPQIASIAREWVANSTSDYDNILAIQNHLRGPEFRYDATVPARDDQFTLLDFLTTTKTGFCQQFASAMAIMLRTLGIPDPRRGRVHVGRAQRRRRPVARHDRQRPRVGRGAVPDLRLAGLRAHAGPHEPDRELLRQPVHGLLGSAGVRSRHGLPRRRRPQPQSDPRPADQRRHPEDGRRRGAAGCRGHGDRARALPVPHRARGRCARSARGARAGADATRPCPAPPRPAATRRTRSARARSSRCTTPSPRRPARWAGRGASARRCRSTGGGWTRPRR